MLRLNEDNGPLWRLAEPTLSSFVAKLDFEVAFCDPFEHDLPGFFAFFGSGALIVGLGRETAPFLPLYIEVSTLFGVAALTGAL